MASTCKGLRLLFLMAIGWLALAVTSSSEMEADRDGKGADAEGMAADEAEDSAGESFRRFALGASSTCSS